MGRKWTESQEKAMQIRNKLLLVSAAAGSGKTSVLTERIIRSLTDREHPADLSRMLIVTFTRAAAAELKARIAAALTEALAEHPSDAHLSRQLFLLGSAQICTIDSFFGQAVRANFEQLGLPASFRIADAHEVGDICLEVLDGVIQDLYTKYEDPSVDPSSPFARLEKNRFANQMDHLLSHRKDAELDQTLLSFLQGFASYPQGIGLLRQYAEQLSCDSELDYFQSSAGRTMQSYMLDALAYFLQELAKASSYLLTDDQAASYFSGVVEAETHFCQALCAALEQANYEEARRVIFTYPSLRFPSMRNKPQPMEIYKQLRGKLKDEMEDWQKNIFCYSSQEIQAQMSETAALCSMLYELFSEYSSRISEEKKSRGLLEFDDVRELLYRLLTKPDGSPSTYAQALSDQYDAVYIDEYQDVDELQDRIFALIGENRRFMVGDIKQSIYGFRGSEPSIFANYRKSMPLHTEAEADTSDAVCVFMSENFRCNRPVIDYANRVCSFLFSACEESVGYRPQDDLVCSKVMPEHTEQPIPVQTLLFAPYPRRKKGEEADPEEKPRREAVWVAAEISRLLREGSLDSGAPIKPSDIAILVRNAAHGNDFAKEMEKLGIPVSASGTQDLIHSALMTDMLNLLRSIDNPYRDIPLSEYLLTPQGGFTLDELSEIRAATPDCKALYDAMLAASEGMTSACAAKASRFVAWLESYRKLASVQPADRFLRLLYLDPQISPNATQPELLLLYEQARLYQRSSWCGLYGFLEHFGKLLVSDSVPCGGFQKAESAVSIMTIHHSKGLEFPVVFLCAMGSRFNTDSLRDNLLFHRKVGVAGKLYNPLTRENENTILREAVKLEIQADQTEESIRTLYVALTRARERMYVTGTTDGDPQRAMEAAALLRYGSRYSILSAGNYLRWILAALQQPTAESHTSPAEIKIVSLTEEIEGIPLQSLEEKDLPTLSHQTPTASEVTEADRILLRQKSFVYPLACLQGIPTKVAASKLRPDLLDHLNDESDSGLDAQIDLMQTAVPSFESLIQSPQTASAADIGTATHAFLEFCDLLSLPSCGIDAECERLITLGFLSEQAANILNKAQLQEFLKSDLLRQVGLANRIYREQTFNLLVPLAELTQTDEHAAVLAHQTVFVQGSIDLLLEMKDGKRILYDYKTDHITEAERKDHRLLQEHFTQRHGNQLACYARAVKQLFGAFPDEIRIYSLPLGNSILIDLKGHPLA